jgi:hypothetical protein
MVEYGLILSMSLGKFLHRLSYDHSLQMTAILIIAVILIVIYGICKL